LFAAELAQRLMMRDDGSKEIWEAPCAGYPAIWSASSRGARDQRLWSLISSSGWRAPPTPSGLVCVDLLSWHERANLGSAPWSQWLGLPRVRSP